MTENEKLYLQELIDTIGEAEAKLIYFTDKTQFEVGFSDWERNKENLLEQKENLEAIGNNWTQINLYKCGAEEVSPFTYEVSLYFKHRNENIDENTESDETVMFEEKKEGLEFFKFVKKKLVSINSKIKDKDLHDKASKELTVADTINTNQEALTTLFNEGVVPAPKKRAIKQP